MLLLKTTFHLQNSLQWDDIYNKCIYPWISSSQDKQTKEKHYANLLKVLPETLHIEDNSEDKFSSGKDSLSYSTFSFKKEDYLGFDFLYSHQNRMWNMRLVFKRNAKYVYCGVSLSCEVEEKMGIPPISKPRIIDHLLEFQDEKGDNKIAIQSQAHFVEKDDAPEIINILEGKSHNKLPIVYLSIYERHALRPAAVAKNLYGIAHVYAEGDKLLSEEIAKNVKMPFPRGGGIAICYPTHQPIIINRKNDKTWKKDPSVLTQDIFRKILRQNIATKAEFSWDDYQLAYTAYLRDVAKKEKESFNLSEASKKELQAKLKQDEQQFLKQIKSLEKQRDSAQSSLKQFVDAFEPENKELKDELQKEKEARIAADENLKALKKKMGPSFALNIPEEPEKYDNEYLNHIICALKMALPKGKGKNSSNRQRNLDVWQAILDANPDAIKKYENYCKERDEMVALARQEKLKSTKGQQLMKKYNLEFQDKKNNHKKINYVGDDRYIATEACSGSDSKSGGKNEASAFERALFCSHK